MPDAAAAPVPSKPFSAAYGTKRERFERQRATMENERSSFVPHWRELNDYILPRRGRFLSTDRNKGDKRNQKIIDNTATIAARTLKSGMTSGISSPARPWFRLSVADKSLAEWGPVKTWLHDTTQRMTAMFLRTNLYSALPTVYGDEGVFATSAMLAIDDRDTILRFYPQPIGSFMCAMNDRLVVDTLMRDFTMTVRQMVMQFGRYDERTGAARWDNFSKQIKDLWDKGDYEQSIDVYHVIGPNIDHDPRALGGRYMPFASCYYEKAADNPNQFLRESGFEEFPAMVTRWDVTGEDTYGTSCPGMEALGDIKSLQTYERRTAQAVEKELNPPLVGPPELKSVRASLLPGDMTYSAERDGQKGLRPIHEVKPDLQKAEFKMEAIRNRIRRTFFEDLFLMLAADQREQPPTAREVAERHEEKLLALGPVLERQNSDKLDHIIDRGFGAMLRRGQIPVPPKELQNMPLKVEYISVMAQAQKLVGISGLDRFLGMGLTLAPIVGPHAMDKIDVDQCFDEAADMLGVPPRVVRSDEQVAEMRSQRAQAQQQQVAAEQAATMADTAKKLSETDVKKDSALTRAAGALSRRGNI